MTGCLLWLAYVRGGDRYDRVILNATLVDGRGDAPFIGGVGINGDRISAVWHGSPWLRPHGTIEETDARGLVLAPGFIDTHTHVDLSLGPGSQPIRADNFVGQGVTTVIAGNCGRSPLSPDLLRRMMESRRANVNIALLVGLNSIRHQILGDSPTPPTTAQVVKLCNLVEEWMREGAVGVSTGYAYVPGRFATPAEITAELGVARRYGAIHATHIRDEGSAILPALDEALGASLSAHVPVLVSHIKITGHANCLLYKRLLARFVSYRAQAGAEGLFFDQYPYDASSTDLDLYLPDWFLALGESQRYQILIHDRERLKNAVKERLRREQFRDLAFATVAHYGLRKEFRGLSIATIDRQFYAHPASTVDSQLDVMFEMLAHGGAQMIYRNICSDVVEMLPRDLPVMVGSDSSIRYEDGVSLPHPRGWGTFPAMLRHLVRERKLLALETAVARMTDLPARVFGLADRGRIEPGYFADLVLFNAATITDHATYEDPFRQPSGICAVFVNGKPVVAQRAIGWNHRSFTTGITANTPGRFIARDSSFKRLRDGMIASTRTRAADKPAREQASILMHMFSPLPTAESVVLRSE